MRRAPPFAEPVGFSGVLAWINQELRSSRRGLSGPLCGLCGDDNAGNERRGAGWAMKSGGFVTFSLPWPPTVNSYWRRVTIYGKPRTLISKAGREYRKSAVSLLRLIALSGAVREGRLAVHIAAFPPDRRARDLDNLPKAVLDAITHAGVWGDDGQVDDLRIVRQKVVKGGELAVRIKLAEK